MPVQLSAPEFEVCIFPHLSMPKRGLKGTLGYCRVFTLILWGLYTGMQWKCVPVPTEAHGNPAIHDTTVSPAILAGGYAPLRKQWLSVLAGHLAHERGATCHASACLPPHSPPYWGSRSARRRISGVRPIPMGVATTRGEDAMARVSLDLENTEDLKVIQAEGWRIAPGLVPGHTHEAKH
jgi:hypothetical protein